MTRLAEDRFSIVTGTAFGQHDRGWMRRHAAATTASVEIRDVTARWACFALWGPRARDILQPLTPTTLGNEAFPYMTMREITVGDVPVRALRVTFVGELGWELYCPTEYGAGLWRALWEAGQPHGLVAGGYRAIDSLRLEKGYRVWGADITPDETPYEAGLGFCVKLDKDGGFIGRDALARAPRRPARPRLACITLDDPRSVALGNEPVRVGGEIVGRVTTGGYGYTVERSIAYAYLPRRARRARHRGGDRHVRRLGRRRGRAPSRCTTRRASACAPERSARRRSARRRPAPAHARAGARARSRRRSRRARCARRRRMTAADGSSSQARRPCAAERGKAWWLWCQASPSDGSASQKTFVEWSSTAKRRRPGEVADRVDAPGDVVQDEDPHEPAPEQAGQQARERASRGGRSRAPPASSER